MGIRTEERTDSQTGLEYGGPADLHAGAQRCLRMEDKARILKQHEQYGYRIAYYLLQNERLALEASVGAIRELLETDRFYRETPDSQRKAVRESFIRHALRVRGLALAGRRD